MGQNLYMKWMPNRTSRPRSVKAHIGKLILFLFLTVLVASFTVSPAAGHVSIIPGFVQEQVKKIEAEGGPHLPSPMSPIGWRDEYTVRVPNEKNVSTVEVQVILPPGFTLVSWAEPEGWVSTVLEDNLGVPRVVIWNGSVIPPEGTDEFGLTLDNPGGLSQRHIFRILQIYEDGRQDIWTISTVTIFPISVGGVEFFTLGYSAAALALVLPVLETTITRLTRMRRLDKTGKG